MTRIRAEIGELTGTNLAQAQSSLEQATAQRVAAEGQLEISRANYTISANFGTEVCLALRAVV